MADFVDAIETWITSATGAIGAVLLASLAIFGVTYGARLLLRAIKGVK